MGAHSQVILEWAPMPLNFTRLMSGLCFRDSDEFYLFLLLVFVAIPLALVRRQIGAAALLAASAAAPLRHMRFGSLFAIVVVIVGGAVLNSFLDGLKTRFACI